MPGPRRHAVAVGRTGADDGSARRAAHEAGDAMFGNARRHPTEIAQQLVVGHLLFGDGLLVRGGHVHEGEHGDGSVVDLQQASVHHNLASDMSITWLGWLRQSPLRPNSRYMREHIERLKVFRSLALPDGFGRRIHQNRLLKMAREGAQMTPHDLAKLEDERRYATLAALAIEGTATVTGTSIGLDCPAKVVAIHFRHHNVEQHQVWLAFPDRRQRQFTIAGNP